MFGIPINELLALPFQRLRLETSLPVAEVNRRMQEAVEPRKFLRISRSHSDFEGVVSLSNFKINRIINRRNSFLPILTGVITPRSQGGTRIDVAMRLQGAVAFFMVLWLGIPCVLAALALMRLRGAIAPTGAPQGSPAGLIAILLGMLVFGYGLCSVAFNIEARRARTLLAKLLDADPKRA